MISQSYLRVGVVRLVMLKDTNQRGNYQRNAPSVHCEKIARSSPQENFAEARSRRSSQAAIDHTGFSAVGVTRSIVASPLMPIILNFVSTESSSAALILSTNSAS